MPRAGRWRAPTGPRSAYVLLNFFPIGWPQLEAVHEHGLAYARSVEFYNSTLVWQWLRLPGDVVFAIAALLMAWDFLLKLGPLYPNLVQRITRRPVIPLPRQAGE